jgi:hypothetical protein
MNDETQVEPTTADEPVNTDSDGELTAAEILKLNESSPEETVEAPTKEATEDPEVETPVEIPPPDEEADTPEGEEADLQLDAELAKNPALKERWDQRMKGVDKLVERNKAQAEALGSWNQIAEALEDPQRAFETYENIGRILADIHGKAPKTLTATAHAAQDKGADWKTLGFEDEDEFMASRLEFDSKEGYQSFKKALHELQGPVIDALKAKIAKLEGDVEGTKAEREAAKAEREKAENAQRYNAWINATAPKVVEQIAKEDQGWKITTDMVDKAVRKFPHLIKTPIEAVYAAYPKELKAHYAKANRKDAPKGPELNTQTSRNAGVALPDDPEDWTAAKVLAIHGT